MEAHVAVCEPCRREYREGQEAIALLRRHWQVSADTQVLLRETRQQAEDGSFGKTIRLHWGFNRAASWTLAAAACLVIGVFGWWVISGRDTLVTGLRGPLASSGWNPPLVIESANDGTRLYPGTTIRTSTGQTRSLVLNGRHQMVMNADTWLSIEPLLEGNQTGCSVNLARGEVYVHVEHDGHPFVVRTPHGKAVITGTMFNMKITETTTALIVVEGDVRFESEGGAVQAVAGQQSTITVTSAPPTTPTACDAIALTVWAHPADQGRQMVQDPRSDDALWEDLPTTPSPRVQIQTDLDRIDHGQWIEQKRSWFKHQFPWIFELKEALNKEDIEADYPILLMQSGDIWRFAYPQARLGQQIAPDPNGLLRTISLYGWDESWLQQQALLFQRVAGYPPQERAAEAFERWIKTIQAQITLCPPRADSGVLLDTLNACLYLAHTRTMAILAISHEFAGTPPQVKERILGLLQEELRTLARCAELSCGLDWAKPDTDTCENLDRLNLLMGKVRKIGELEKRVREYEKAFRE